MGNSSSQTHSFSSVNGVGIENHQVSTCSWYNPFCTGSNANSQTSLGNVSAPFMVGGMATILILILLIVVIIHRHAGAPKIDAAKGVANKFRNLFHFSSRKISESELEFVTLYV